MNTVKTYRVCDYIAKGLGNKRQIADQVGVDPSFISKKANDPDFHLIIKAGVITHFAQFKPSRGLDPKAAKKANRSK